MSSQNELLTYDRQAGLSALVWNKSRGVTLGPQLAFFSALGSFVSSLPQSNAPPLCQASIPSIGLGFGSLDPNL